ncbi:hypothetical protein GCM10009817_06630 [Terrabacter lapilli]|uniref:XRE family transcriptional regulator n=1 Tax=Terrabacter lapilli TaxID=436231 RepID=A0ABN2RIG4_9MICO
MSDDLQRMARAFGDNMAALLANTDRPMTMDTLAVVSEAVGVPVSVLVSPAFDVTQAPGRPRLQVV